MSAVLHRSMNRQGPGQAAETSRSKRWPQEDLPRQRVAAKAVPVAVDAVAKAVPVATTRT
jgi:hypothetical protein